MQGLKVLILCAFLLLGVISHAKTLLDSTSTESSIQHSKKIPASIKNTSEKTSPPVHAITLFGKPKYQKGFKHFDYVNVNAKQGGELRSFALGSFDSLNPFIQKGNAESNVISLVYETLGISSLDEVASVYGLIAKEFIIDPDGFYLICVIDENASFSDGVKITSSDVVFSFESLMKFGKLEYRHYYADIKSVEALDEHRVKFNFKSNQNKELALIIAELPVLPAHIFASAKTTNPLESKILENPIGSGPYLVESFEVGRNIIFVKNPNYWAKNHPTRKGTFNFKHIKIEYYKDPVVAQQAFMSGAYDWRIESSAKVWAKDYESKSANLIKKILPNKLPSTLQGFFFNTTREVFADVRVREAISYAFDFEWSNKYLFFNQYARTLNIFDNSPFASSGLPSGKERKILQNLEAKFGKNDFDRRILESKFIIPRTDFNLPHGYVEGDRDWEGNIHKKGAKILGQDKRANLLYAQKLLKQAGYSYKNGKLVDKSGKPFTFEILINYEGFERICLPFIENLKMLGIEASLKRVDDGQYANRLRTLEYDMVVELVGQSLNPGNELNFYFSSNGVKSGRNYAGVSDERVDYLISKIISADEEEKKYYLRALDRVLLWGFYVITHFHSEGYRLAFWQDRITIPASAPDYGFSQYLWWAK